MAMTHAEEVIRETNAASSDDELIGGTPLDRLDSFADTNLGKLVSTNPYSVKDLIARNIVDAAEREGSLPSGWTVVEASFHILNQRYGDRLTARKWYGQFRELVLKASVHNIDRCVGPSHC